VPVGANSLAYNSLWQLRNDARSSPPGLLPVLQRQLLRVPHARGGGAADGERRPDPVDAIRHPLPARLPRARARPGVQRADPGVHAEPRHPRDPVTGPISVTASTSTRPWRSRRPPAARTSTGCGRSGGGPPPRRRSPQAILKSFFRTDLGACPRPAHPFDRGAGSRGRGRRLGPPHRRPGWGLGAGGPVTVSLLPPAP
jgi:hypothetical protein